MRPTTDGPVSMRPGSTGRYRLWAAAVVSLLGAASIGTPAAAQQDTILMEAAVQLYIEQGPSEIVPALVYNGTLLLPVRQFLTMSEVRVTAFDRYDSLTAVLEPQGIRVSFHPDRDVLLVGDTAVPLGPGDVSWDGDLFAATHILERAFSVVVRVEWADLTAFVGQTSHLPVVRRKRRERQRALLDRPTPRPGMEIRPSLSTVDGALLNWSFTGSTGVRTDYYNLDLGLGARLYDGSLTLRPSLWSIGGRTGGDIRGSWERAWPDQEWVRQVRIGDVHTGGRRAQLIRGAVVTNAPFIRSSEFDVEQVVGSLPPGWEVELYDRGRLLGYGEVDALGTFQVPLAVRYGQNPFELVLYGPAGETVRHRRTIRVPFSRLPAGRLEYAGAVGGCRFEACKALLSADVRYGLTTRATLQGGMDFFDKQSGGMLWQPYAAASVSVLPPLSVTAEAVLNGHLRGAVDYEPTPDLRLSAGHTDFAESGMELSAGFETSRSEASALWRPGALSGTLYLQAFAARSAQPGTVRSIARLSASARLGRLRYTLGVRHDGLRPVSGDGSSYLAFDAGVDGILPPVREWLRGTNVRGEMSVAPAEGLAALAVTAGRRVGRDIRADVGVGWFRGAGIGLSLGFTTAMAGPRVGVRTQANTVGGANSTVFVNGSMVYQPDQRTVRWTDGGDLGRAGVTGILFFDTNGNGVRDEGEPGVADIPIQVGGWNATTDAHGRFSVWDLFPFESVEIVVDSLAFDDPRFVTVSPVLRVRPAPNSFVPIEIPVVVGAEISGWVVLNGEALAGIPVIFHELNTGAEIVTLTFSDGTFYRTGVPPGEYEVTLPEAIAEALGIYVLPLHIFIPPGPGDKRFENLGIEIGRIQLER